MRHTLIPLAAAVFAIPAFAQPHQGDIILTLDGGRIVTNAGNTNPQPERVFTTRLGQTFPDFTDSPGFDCYPGTFPVGTRNGFRILDALRAWNHADFNTVSPSPMEIAFSTLSIQTPPAPEVVEGFTLAVGSNGEWHRHLEYSLLNPADDGVYLLSLQLYSTAPSIADSLPFWLVFGNNATDDDLAVAAQWVRDTLAATPPCNPDFNQDGSADQDDVAYLINALSGGENPSGADLDFNLDGNTDQDDVAALIGTIAGADCP